MQGMLYLHQPIFVCSLARSRRNNPFHRSLVTVHEAIFKGSKSYLCKIKHPEAHMGKAVPAHRS